MYKVTIGRGLGLAAAVLLALSALPAQASTIFTPLTAAQFTSLNGSGASYGPPPPVNFTEPGPITVNSGTTTDLFAGPKPGQKNVTNLVFVFSGASNAFAGTIDLTLKDRNGNPIGTASFDSSNFFSTAAAGFPSLMGGIGNGQVYNIAFPSAYHAGIEVPLSDFGTLTTGNVVGQIDVVTINAVDLRVDIFGVNSKGRIINNTPNSGALGIADAPIPVPEPGILAVLGGALLGFVAFRRRRA